MHLTEQAERLTLAERDRPVLTPAMIEAGMAFVRDFYPAEWGGVRGIRDAEAKALVSGLLSAVLGPRDAGSTSN